MNTLAKLAGVLIALVGILATFADLRGCFADPQKQHFAELVMGTQEGIPRSTPGFEAFLVAFPPPQGVDLSGVTHIADRTLRLDSRSDVGTTVAYLTSAGRTATVARFEEVRAWAEASPYSWLSLGITFLGWVLYAVIEICDFLTSRRAA
jgi:hypothetical protein